MFISREIDHENEGSKDESGNSAKLGGLFVQLHIGFLLEITIIFATTSDADAAAFEVIIVGIAVISARRFAGIEIVIRATAIVFLTFRRIIARAFGAVRLTTREARIIVCIFTHHC